MASIRRVAGTEIARNGHSGGHSRAAARFTVSQPIGPPGDAAQHKIAVLLMEAGGSYNKRATRTQSRRTFTGI
jgi:hypothetical protein